MTVVMLIIVQIDPCVSNLWYPDSLNSYNLESIALLNPFRWFHLPLSPSSLQHFEKQLH